MSARKSNGLYCYNGRVEKGGITLPYYVGLKKKYGFTNFFCTDAIYKISSS